MLQNQGDVRPHLRTMLKGVIVADGKFNKWLVLHYLICSMVDDEFHKSYMEFPIIDRYGQVEQKSKN